MVSRRQSAKGLAQSKTWRTGNGLLVAKRLGVSTLRSIATEDGR